MGEQVVLAANEEPSCNDILASELIEVLKEASQLDDIIRCDVGNLGCHIGNLGCLLKSLFPRRSQGERCKNGHTVWTGNGSP